MSTFWFLCLCMLIHLSPNSYVTGKTFPTGPRRHWPFGTIPTRPTAWSLFPRPPRPWPPIPSIWLRSTTTEPDGSFESHETQEPPIEGHTDSNEEDSTTTTTAAEDSMTTTTESSTTTTAAEDSMTTTTESSTTTTLVEEVTDENVVTENAAVTDENIVTEEPVVDTDSSTISSTTGEEFILVPLRRRRRSWFRFNN